MIVTSGAGQNSYITLSEANALLLTVAASFMSDDAADNQLGVDDERYLIEAAADLNLLWNWDGEATDPAQPLAWPRRFVTKPGYRAPLEPGWSLPFDYADWIACKPYLYGATNAAQFIPDDEAPQLIKEAQALIALLKKQGSNLVGDNQGDLQGTQIGKIKVSYVNAIRESADIHKRTGQFGRFSAGLLTGV